MYCMNYVIQKGDTLYSISRHFNIGIAAIMAANPFINVYNLMVGEVLCIPMSIPSDNVMNYATYQVVEGDTIGSVLEHYGINLSDLMQRNSLDNLYLLPGTTLNVPILDGEE